MDIESKECTRRDALKTAAKLSPVVSLMLLSSQSSTARNIANAFASREESEVFEKACVRSRKLGITFSSLQCEYLGFDKRETVEILETLCRMKFDIIRICNYWNRLDKNGRFDFSELFWQLDMLGKYDIEAILTLGVKSPRHPEFFYPKQILADYPELVKSPSSISKYPKAVNRLFEYNARLIESTRDYSFIKYFQVENEPRNRVGVGEFHILDYELIQEEAERVRKLIKPHQKIMMTNSVGDPIIDSPENKFYETLKLNPDALGLSVYEKTPLPFGFYNHVAKDFWDKQIVRWLKEMRARNIDPLIAESQAEPWEMDKQTNLDKREYPSINPKSAMNLASRLGCLGYETVLLWGAEYWYAHKIRYQTSEWFNAVETLINGELAT